MAEQGKPVRDVKGAEPILDPKKDPNKIEFLPGNYQLVVLRMLTAINTNLVSILGVLKVLAEKKEKEKKDGGSN